MHNPPRMNRYHNLSLQLVQREHPSWTAKQQLAEAQKQFDAAALTLLVETLKAAKSVRPAAKWGYYGYPGGCVQMSKPTDRDPIRNGKLCQAANDKMAPLFAETTGFFPAIYLPADAGHGWPSSAALKRYVTSIVDEATRARGNAGSAHDTPLLVYVWPKYLNGSTFLSAEDLEMSFSIPHSGCADGMVVWGDRLNAADAAFWSYTKAAIGPVLERIRSSVRPQCRGGEAA
jgi:hyaluronoglucosaminidase